MQHDEPLMLLQQVVPLVQQTAPPPETTPQTSPLGQHWPPMQVELLSQVPQLTSWPQLFLADPQVWLPQVVVTLSGVQQVRLAVQI